MNLASNPDEIPVTDEQLNELDHRFDEYQQDPDKVVTWEDVKTKILPSRAKEKSVAKESV